MNSFLLYEDTDQLRDPPYFDEKNIIQDLGLETLFLAASREVICEHGEIKRFGDEDSFIRSTMRKVMTVPLRNEGQILYRQEILRDFIEHPEVIQALYGISSRVLDGWNALGRYATSRANSSHPAAKLMTEIRLITLFFENVKEIRELLDGHGEELRSGGLRNLTARLGEEFSEEREAYIGKILEDISFYTGDAERNNPEADKVIKPRIVLECSVEHGLKISDLKLQEVSSRRQRFYREGGTISMIRDFINSRSPDSFQTTREISVRDQVNRLELQVVEYLVGSIASFSSAFGPFFDSLHMQSAFYLGAVNLKILMNHYGLASCFPKVCGKDRLVFRELKEFAMCLAQRIRAVGNTCCLEHITLLVVTGANQGGKSTFLRSIGLAQVMMQSGLMAAAECYESSVFPDLFTHFTRREDSAMNSGRLDEELRRMDRIIDNLGERPLILLNESFASTSEKEGSAIAWDIVRALHEAGVKILMVTHLLSFAQKLYRESGTDPDSCTEFLSAERKENGVRTFRMIRHEPESTSFGLDLYRDIVENRKDNGKKGAP